VVDDGSKDDTAEVAAACDDGSGRLRVTRQANTGPSAARNAGVRMTSAPLWCVLDADDAFVPGRFGRLFAALPEDWDMAADGIEFALPDGSQDRLEPAPRGVRTLSLADFVEGNVSRRKVPRCELGYLQPVKRRAFFDARGLEFDTALRFAEDYALYARALAAGARFLCTKGAGYVANVRPGSLSHTQTAADYEALIAFDRGLLPNRTRHERRAIRRHMRMMRLKAQYLKVHAALAAGDRRGALRHAFRDHHTAGFMFNHRYRAGLSQKAKRWLRLEPLRELLRKPRPRSARTRTRAVRSDRALRRAPGAIGPHVWGWGLPAGALIFWWGVTYLPWWAAAFLWWWPSFMAGGLVSLLAMRLVSAGLGKAFRDAARVARRRPPVEPRPGPLGHGGYAIRQRLDGSGPIPSLAMTRGLGHEPWASPAGSAAGAARSDPAAARQGRTAKAAPAPDGAAA